MVIGQHLSQLLRTRQCNSLAEKSDRKKHAGHFPHYEWNP